MEVRPGYKQTEAGVIPESWEAKPLGAVLSVGRLGGNYPNQDAETAFPLMKMGNIARGYFDLAKVEFVTHGVTPEDQHRLIRGDVLFNTRNTLDLVGKVAIWRDELPVAYYNSNLMRLEFDRREICPAEYANYALNTASSIGRLRALATGTTSVAAIYTRDLLALQFVVPPPPEQRAIAKALGDVDALLAGLDRLIAKKYDLKQAAMQHLLAGDTRLPQVGAQRGYKRSEVGLIPVDWHVQRLLASLRVVSGQVDPRVEPYASMTLVAPDHIESGTGRLIARHTAAEQRAISGKYEFQMGDVVYSKIRPYLKKAIVAEFDGLCSADMYVLSPVGDVSAKFMLAVLLGRRFTLFAESVSTRSGMPKINRAELGEYRLAVPPPHEQAAIAEVLSDMDAELAALEARREKTLSLKQAMMEELLTGRIRLV